MLLVKRSLRERLFDRGQQTQSQIDSVSDD